LVGLKITHSPLLIQQYLPGSGHGVNVLSRQGKIIQYFEYERLHEPGFGGGSSLRRSVKTDQKLKKQCEELLKSFSYTGVGMCEFRYSASKYYLMEFNARFWGSLNLPMFCGMDFPKLLLASSTQSNADQICYHTNRSARNLSKDLKWHIKNINFKTSLEIIILPVSILYGLILRKETLDIEKFDDPCPSLLHYSLLFRKAFTRVAELYYLKLFSLFSIFYRFKFKSRLVSASTICFVCRGNIIRSAFAEAYLNKKYDNSDDISRLQVVSLGTIDIINRKCPKKAIEVADEYGVDLRNHLSKSLQTWQGESVGTIFITKDIRQFYAVKRSHPLCTVFPMGLFSSTDVCIADPYRKDIEQYKKSFALIKEALDNLFNESI
jgi:protein-tyrosine-phosphatase